MLVTKVNAEIYNAEIRDIREDIQVLKAKPEMMRNWLWIAIAGGGCAVTVLSLIISTIVLLAAIWLQVR